MTLSEAELETIREQQRSANVDALRKGAAENPAKAKEPKQPCVGSPTQGCLAPLPLCLRRRMAPGHLQRSLELKLA